MKTLIAVFALLLCAASASAQINSQDACATLGINCRLPHVDQRPRQQQERRPICDADCQRRNQEYEEWREKERQRKAAIKEENKRIEAANKLASKAWAATQAQDCAGAIGLYEQALVLHDWLQWKINRAICLGTVKNWAGAFDAWESMINDPQTPDDQIKSLRWSEWNLMYDRGYKCPEPPYFHGLEGCHRRADQKTLDSIYVPLPYIEGKTWYPKAVLSSGDFTVTLKDGHVYHSGEINMTTVNMMNARIQTTAGTAVHFLLPDETAFTLGPNSDLTVDDFVYDPNTNLTTLTATLLKGTFRFFTGKIAQRDPSHDPVSRQIKLPVGSLGSRGTDYEVWHDPNSHSQAVGTATYGSDRWRACTYDGTVTMMAPGETDISDIVHQSGTKVTDDITLIPVGYCFTKRTDDPSTPEIFRRGNGQSVDGNSEWDGSHYNTIKNSRLSVIDFWDDVPEMQPQIVGRQ